jgi:hypothetical protein
MNGVTKRVILVLAAANLAALAGGTLWAAPAAAVEPMKESFGPVEVVFPDFFGNDPISPRCDFAVVGDWMVSGSSTTFYDSDGNVTRIATHFSFEGTLSNPLTGESVLDGGTESITDYFASDGSFIKETEEAVRLGFLRAAFHTVIDAQGEIVTDVGRDWLLIDKHPIDITPLCDALG